MTLLDVFYNLGIFGLLVLAFGWILRLFIQGIFSKDLEKFKSDLRVEAIKSKTKFEILHTERATVIKETYRRLVSVQRHFESLMRPLQLAGESSEEEKKTIAAQEFNKLFEYFDENRIYFEENIAQDIDDFIKRG